MQSPTPFSNGYYNKIISNIGEGRVARAKNRYNWLAPKIVTQVAVLI